MKIRPFLAATAAAVALSTLAPVASSAAPAGPTLTDILESQGGGTDANAADFDILAAGVAAAGLSAALDDPAADLTVFLPTDEAFRVLVTDLFGQQYRTASEAVVLGKVVEIETGAPGTLQTVILYHAVSGQIDSDTALSVPRRTPLTTLQGGIIRVNPVPVAGSALLVDQDPNDLDPFLNPRQLDIQASNGIAHGINKVLRPVDL